MKKINSSGFTLLELVIVMAMIGIISSASFKLIRFSETQRNLSIATAEVKGVIRTAQTLALAPPVITGIPTICGFGIKNDTTNKNKLEIYYSHNDGNVKDCRNIADVASACNGSNECDNYETKYFEGFEVTQLPGGVNIFFRSPYGKVFGAGDIKIEQTDNSYAKTIKVNEYGKISVVIP